MIPGANKIAPGNLYVADNQAVTFRGGGLALLFQAGFYGVVGLAGVEAGGLQGFLEGCGGMLLQVFVHMLQAQAVDVGEETAEFGFEETGNVGTAVAAAVGHVLDGKGCICRVFHRQQTRQSMLSGSRAAQERQAGD